MSILILPVVVYININVWIDNHIKKCMLGFFKQKIMKIANLNKILSIGYYFIIKITLRLLFICEKLFNGLNAKSILYLVLFHGNFIIASYKCLVIK